MKRPSQRKSYKWVALVGIVAVCTYWGGRVLQRVLTRPWVRSLNFSPDGKFLAIGGGIIPAREVSGENGRVWVWNVATNHREQQLSAPQPTVFAGFSPTGRLLMARQTDKRCIVWDTQLWRVQTSLISAPAALDTLDHRVVLSQKTADHWNARIQSMLRAHPDKAFFPVTLAEDGRHGRDFRL